MRAMGTVINIHHHGGTVRLTDGRLASIPEAELVAHRPRYVASHAKREPISLVVAPHGRHPTVALDEPTPHVATDRVAFADVVFEARMDAYLKSTEAWAPADQAPPAERHFIAKKRRARLFEASPDAT
ncbi:MAG: hypothetical protein NVS2B8_14630 [Vulcanimicrobiaceae bacterium]